MRADINSEAARSNDSVESHKRMDTCCSFCASTLEISIYTRVDTRVHVGSEPYKYIYRYTYIYIYIYIYINISETRIDMEQAGARVA